jgi:hypothetical protein
MCERHSDKRVAWREGQMEAWLRPGSAVLLGLRGRKSMREESAKAHLLFSIFQEKKEKTCGNGSLISTLYFLHSQTT